MKNKLILLSLVGVIALGIVFLYRNDSTEVSVTETAEDVLVAEAETTSLTDEVVGETAADITDTTVIETAATTNTETSVPTASVYADGTYTVTQEYSVPSGEVESVTVTLTLADDVVTGLDTTYVANERESREYQSRFDSRIDAAVIGQSLEDISVSRVGGASLTTKAFNEALVEIKREANA